MQNLASGQPKVQRQPSRLTCLETVEKAGCCHAVWGLLETQFKHVSNMFARTYLKHLLCAGELIIQEQTELPGSGL